MLYINEILLLNISIYKVVFEFLTQPIIKNIGTNSLYPQPRTIHKNVICCIYRNIKVLSTGNSCNFLDQTKHFSLSIFTMQLIFSYISVNEVKKKM